MKDINQKFGEYYAFQTGAESYFCNGWGFVTADQLGQLSDCPIIIEDFTIEDNGDYLLNGKSWYFPNYMVKSIIDELIEFNQTVFTFWQEFQNQNVKM